MATLQPILRDAFSAATLPPSLRWHCEPRRWSLDHSARALRLSPDAPTDFWQRTHYGFAADNGHFLFREVAGDFVLTGHVRFKPVHQYDQAGVMVRVSKSCWIKSSVEHEPGGASRLGAVVTNHGYSDWSTQDFAPGPGHVWLRVRREGDDCLVESSSDGHSWTQIRMAHLHEGSEMPVAIGVYACSPKGEGFQAEFTHFAIDAGRIG